jgi:hypothetical protein
VSTWHHASALCPCGYAFDTRFVRGANVMRSEALREAALAGTLNIATCPGCGVPRPLDAPLVYADFRRGHWIAVARLANIRAWADIERATLAAFRTCLDTAVAFELPPMAVRLVFELDELRERLAIWDAGLDDAHVEYAKLSCLSENPAIRGPQGRIRVVSITEREIAMESDRGHWTVDRATVDRIALDPTWAAHFPALAEHGFVSIDRYLL